MPMKTHKLVLLFAWFKMRKIALLYFAAMFAIYLAVCALNSLPIKVAVYAALICAVLGFGLAIFDFVRFAGKHYFLIKSIGKFPLTLPQVADNLIEDDYERLTLALEAERTRLESAGEYARHDAQEYYTLWAHQIKTPISAMELLLHAKNTNSVSLHEDLRQELFRIEQYVEMVLQYQRLSSIENDLVLQEISIENLVKQAAKTCAPLFIHKGLGLSTSGVTGSIVTDEKWFCFVLEQLFSNAAKYTYNGTIRTYTKNENTLVIQDTGIGIAPEDIPRVFERGFTGAVGRTERSSTGIGLYLCKRILSKLGFGISLKSTPGQGTIVFLHLKQNTQKLD